MDKSFDKIKEFSVEQYPWCTALRAVKGVDMAEQQIIAVWRAASKFQLLPIDVERLTAVTQGEMIDRFLRLEDYRIVADDKAADEEISLEASLDDEDDLVSEELAEIYVAQGLNCEAVEIYRKLSLLNPKKSAYFAAQIEKLSNL